MNLILASASPRRKDILDIFNMDYSVKVPAIQEIFYSQFSPSINSMHVAYQKAVNVANNNIKSTIIAADTVVSIGDEIFGKPKDSNHAFQMIQRLSGKKHQVVTGFCILNLEKGILYIDCVKTDVYFHELSDDIINIYIKSNEYIDKAGAYAIQGLASVFVDKIDGDYYNVVGLPISAINMVLSKYFSYDLLK